MLNAQLGKTYNKEEALSFLRSPYKKGKRRKRGKPMRRLRGRIMNINKRTRRKGDCIQNKYRFRKKVETVVNVPKMYYYGRDLKQLRNIIPTLDKFVLKPNHLSRGIGIRVLTRNGSSYVDLNEDILTLDDILDECEAIVKLRRYGTAQNIILEEAIVSHKKYNCIGMADIRMIFYFNNFLMCIARIPSEESGGYGNIIRGAGWGVVLQNGKYVDSKLFQPTTVKSGNLPFFNKLVRAGKKVSRTYGLAFQAIDMTVNEEGKVFVIESESMPQIEYYLTPRGIRWMNRKLSGNRRYINHRRNKGRGKKRL